MDRPALAQRVHGASSRAVGRPRRARRRPSASRPARRSARPSSPSVVAAVTPNLPDRARTNTKRSAAGVAQSQAMTEVSSPTLVDPADPLQAGRDALARHDWTEAFELLSRADRETAVGHRTSSTSRRRRSSPPARTSSSRSRSGRSRPTSAEGNDLRAAFIALDLAHHHFFAGKESIAAGVGAGEPSGSWGPRATRTPTAT